MTCNNVVEVNTIHKSYGGKCVLCGISFNVRRGELFSVVGPNGAGKTTLLEIILGLRKPDKGFVRIFCQEEVSRVIDKIGFVLEGMSLRPTLSVTENLQLIADIRGFRVTRRDVIRILELLHMSDHRDTPYGKLSAGLKKRANIAAALLGDPELLILDEPEANLDPLSRIETMDTLLDVARKKNVTVIYSTHVLSIADKYSDRVLILDKGRMVALGDPREIVMAHAKTWRVKLRIRGGSDIIRAKYDFIKVDDSFYIIEIRNIDEITNLLDMLKSSNIYVDYLSIEHPRLDDIFKELVGGDESAES